MPEKRVKFCIDPIYFFFILLSKEHSGCPRLYRKEAGRNPKLRRGKDVSTDHFIYGTMGGSLLRNAG